MEVLRTSKYVKMLKTTSHLIAIWILTSIWINALSGDFSLRPHRGRFLAHWMGFILVTMATESHHQYWSIGAACRAPIINTSPSEQVLKGTAGSEVTGKRLHACSWFWTLQRNVVCCAAPQPSLVLSTFPMEPCVCIWLKKTWNTKVFFLGF